jgi:hypothetical protein
MAEKTVTLKYGRKIVVIFLTIENLRRVFNVVSSTSR